MNKMEKLIERIELFVEERNWSQFHSPKNLAIGISVEASELLELFIWLSENESNNLTEAQLLKIRNEIGDIMINLLNFCNTLRIDPVVCAIEKLEINASKYPVEKSFGSAVKYDEL